MKKKYETLFYSAAGVVAMALILIAFNVITGEFRLRLDMTREKAYTLSKGTRDILAKLDSPVKIRFYCTQNVTPTGETIYLKNYAREVEDLLDEYSQESNGKLIVEKYDPEPDSDAEDSAQLDGIEAQTLPDGDKFYLGLAVSQLDQKQTIPFLSPTRERLLEYDLTRAISKVIDPQKATIGVMTPLPVFGTPANPMMGMRQQSQSPWEFIKELKSDYDVQRVPMDTDKIDDDIKVLLVIHPRGISARAQYAIDQFIMRGGKLIAFLDPLSLVDASQQRSMMGGPSGEGSSLPDLLKAWGLHFDTSKVVADMNFKMRMGGG
ncbi:MAG TPA: GldG family protein, partial [Verrucomicrobiae bacterium]|nr:GldG family protein [Verrucomicrobiae bacterium]